jgi:hypothetical protein
MNMTKDEQKSDHSLRRSIIYLVPLSLPPSTAMLLLLFSVE